MKRQPGYSVKYGSQFIRLTQGVIALVDPDVLSKFGRLNWCALKIDHRWYAVRNANINNKRSLILMHREIINAPQGVEVDHRKHYPFETRIIDNRLSNLRLATRIENGQNQRHQICQNSSKYKGVSWRKDRFKWRAYITVNDCQKHLGHFISEIDAARAYDHAALKLHGKFALLNFGENR